MLLESENSSLLTLQVRRLTPATQSPTAASRANLATLMACCLLAGTALFRGTFSTVLLVAVVTLLLSGMWYTDAEQSSLPTANVDVHTPRYASDQIPNTADGQYKLDWCGVMWLECLVKHVIITIYY